VDVELGSRGLSDDVRNGYYIQEWIITGIYHMLLALVVGTIFI
jgi:hypothetical protein